MHEVMRAEREQLDRMMSGIIAGAALAPPPPAKLTYPEYVERCLNYWDYQVRLARINGTPLPTDHWSRDPLYDAFTRKRRF